MIEQLLQKRDDATSVKVIETCCVLAESFADTIDKDDTPIEPADALRMLARIMRETALTVFKGE